LFSYLQPEGNHGAYRAALSSAQKKGEPHLPHLAVHLRDFLYISDAVEKDTSMEGEGGKKGWREVGKEGSREVGKSGGREVGTKSF
jgi:hypothetical protein